MKKETKYSVTRTRLCMCTRHREERTTTNRYVNEGFRKEVTLGRKLELGQNTGRKGYSMSEIQHVKRHTDTTKHA